MLLCPKFGLQSLDSKLTEFETQFFDCYLVRPVTVSRSAHIVGSQQWTRFEQFETKFILVLYWLWLRDVLPKRFEWVGNVWIPNTGCSPAIQQPRIVVFFFGFFSTELQTLSTSVWSSVTGVTPHLTNSLGILLYERCCPSLFTSRFFRSSPSGLLFSCIFMYQKDFLKFLTLLCFPSF